ncbi:sphinganine C4-monooxygenase 2-like, partial [Dendrobium catenatum]
MESIIFDRRMTNSSSNLTPTVMPFPVSDELLGTFVPIAVYWIYSGIYVMLGDLNQYRLHTKAEEDKKNVVSKRTVVKGVLIQQAFQIAVSLLLFTFMSGDSGVVLLQPSLPVIVLQFMVAMVVMDTW